MTFGKKIYFLFSKDGCSADINLLAPWILLFRLLFCRTRDSGFNSELPSCGCVGEQGELPSALLASDLNSGFLAQYGLDGPLDEYPDDPEEELEGGGLDLLGMPPAPSVTSINTKRKRKEDLKQATIRQHYYPEGTISKNTWKIVYFIALHFDAFFAEWQPFFKRIINLNQK